MKKNLFCMWLACLAILFSVNTQAQMTIGGKKEPEAFSVLELLNKGGLRLPQMTTVQRNAFAVQGKVQGEGLTIYNIDTKCVEYWNKVRWVSLCEGTSQTTISPEPCINVAADGSGCNSTFTVNDPDCPNGPFNIAIVAGGEYAALDDLDNVNGSFKINFFQNETVNTRTVLVRVTSTCTSLFKEFLFSQKGVDCSSMSYAVPNLSSTGTELCTGGAIYLSVPANTPNLDKLIWTRNGIEVARGVSYYVATQKGKYNISMGAVGCNTNVANEKNITESGTADQVNITALASNNGVLCGSNSVTLTASGTTGSIVWFHNGIEDRSGKTITISGDSSIGEWFAATKSGTCYSKPSNSITVTKSEASGQISLPGADVLVNGVPLNSFNSFCAGGSLDLSVANKQNGITYTWYNGNDVISSNPFIVPSSQSTMSLRLVATDNSGSKCAAEANVLEKSITSGDTPDVPEIITGTGNATICGGSLLLTLKPRSGNPADYNYTWYKDGVKMTETTQSINVKTPGVEYAGSVSNSTGCTSPLAKIKIASTESALAVLSWETKQADANYGSEVSVTVKGTAASYTWSVDKGALFTANNAATYTSSGPTVTIKIPLSGTDGDNLTIKVTAKNDCGTSSELSGTIAMKSACPTPLVTAQSATTQNTTANSGVNLSVSVDPNSISNPTYKWYKNDSNSNTGGTEVGSGTSYFYTPTAAGDFYLYFEAKNGCAGNPVGKSPVFKVTASEDPSNIKAGSGTLSGKTCFDIAQTEGGTSCGTLATRQSNKSDFSKPEINTQKYTFTPQGTVSKVRFVCVETVGKDKIVQEISGGNSGLNISSPVTATIVYKSNLSGPNGTAVGLSTTTAYSLDIYAIYNNKADGTGEDLRVKLTAKIKDCACCGAMVSATEWREFMCYNIGADTTKDPLTPDVALLGTYTVWSKRSSCPAGYHIPTKTEWENVKNNNSKTFVGTLSYDKSGKYGYGGVLFGPNLMLPNCGIKGANSQYQIGYWAAESNMLLFDVNGYGTKGLTVGGASTDQQVNVRCMADN